MQLTIYRTNVDATPSLLAYIDARLKKSLARVTGHVDDITVRIADINGRVAEKINVALFI